VGSIDVLFDAAGFCPGRRSANDSHAGGAFGVAGRSRFNGGFARLLTTGIRQSDVAQPAAADGSKYQQDDNSWNSDP